MVNSVLFPLHVKAPFTAEAMPAKIREERSRAWIFSLPKVLRVSVDLCTL